MALAEGILHIKGTDDPENPFAYMTSQHIPTPEGTTAWRYMKERNVMKRKGRKILAVVLCLALMAGPVPVFASAAEAAEEEERERTQALYGEEEEPKESSPGETEFVPTPAESENIRERMSELAWEINQLDDQIAGLAPEEADALQQEREVKMQEYEAGEAELYAMGAIPTEEELREVTGLGQESESGISFRSLPNFSSIYDIFLITHMQCKMYSSGIYYDVINYTVQQKPNQSQNTEKTILYRNTTIIMSDEGSSVTNPLFKLIVSEGAGHVASLLTKNIPIVNDVVSFLASEAVARLFEKDPKELQYNHLGGYVLIIDGITTMRYVYVKESGGEYVLSNAVSSTKMWETHVITWSDGINIYDERAQDVYFIQGGFTNGDAARDAVDNYEYYKKRNSPVQPLTQRPVNITYVTRTGAKYKYQPYFADTPHTLTSDAL